MGLQISNDTADARRSTQEQIVFLQNTHMRRKNVEWVNQMLPLAYMASMKTFTVRLI